MKTASQGKYWSVPRSWYGETCFIVAGGPGLIGFDRSWIEGRGRIIVINDSFRLIPDADVLYFHDTRWWNRRRTEVTHCFTGQIVTMENPKLERCRSLRDLGQLGLSEDPTGLKNGDNGGYQAINLAYLFGVRRIVLLGYDLQVLNGRTHWNNDCESFGETPEACDRKLQKDFVPCFAYLVAPLRKANVEVINCTPSSALPYWPIQSLSETLYNIQHEDDAANHRTDSLNLPV
jgi:hypothetical protein